MDSIKKGATEKEEEKPPSPGPLHPTRKSTTAVKIDGSQHVKFLPQRQPESQGPSLQPLDAGVSSSSAVVTDKGRKRSSQQKRRTLVRLVRAQPRPCILKHYEIFAYIVLTVDIIACIIYLSFVAYVQTQQELYMQYLYVHELLRYVSYNLVCPVVGITVMVIIMYLIKTKGKMRDGNYFFLLGTLLLFWLIMVYDAHGVNVLYLGRAAYVDDPKQYDEVDNTTNDNELAWNYAWSTKPTCARVHARQMKKRNKEREKEEKINTSPPHYYFRPINTGRQLNLAKQNQTDSLTPDEIAYQQQCNSTYYSNTKEDIRSWMSHVQKTQKCCGPFGYDHWKERINKIDEHCKEGKDSCARPFNIYLRDRFQLLLVMLTCMCVVFLLAFVVASMHFAATKYEDQGVHKHYPLLDLSLPENYHVIETDTTKAALERRSRALLSSGSARGILGTSSVRSQRSRKGLLPVTSSKKNMYQIPAHPSAKLADLRLLSWATMALKEGSEKEKLRQPHAEPTEADILEAQTKEVEAAASAVDDLGPHDVMDMRMRTKKNKNNKGKSKETNKKRKSKAPDDIPIVTRKRSIFPVPGGGQPLSTRPSLMGMLHQPPTPQLSQSPSQQSTGHPALLGAAGHPPPHVNEKGLLKVKKEKKDKDKDA